MRFFGILLETVREGIVLRAAIVSVVAAILLLACSSGDKPSPTPTATVQPTATQAPTPAPAGGDQSSPSQQAPAQQQPASQPAQQQGPPPGQVACVVATSAEVAALQTLIQTALSTFGAAQQPAVRLAMAPVDRNNDGIVDANVCRDTVVQVTQALNALRPR